MVQSRFYYGFPGFTGFSDPALSNATILHVAREGVSYVQTFNEQAGSLQFIYSAYSGGIAFDPNNPFTAYTFSRRAFEKILVIWKT